MVVLGEEKRPTEGLLCMGKQLLSYMGKWKRSTKLKMSTQGILKRNVNGQLWMKESRLAARKVTIHLEEWKSTPKSLVTLPWKVDDMVNETGKHFDCVSWCWQLLQNWNELGTNMPGMHEDMRREKQIPGGPGLEELENITTPPF